MPVSLLNNTSIPYGKLCFTIVKKPKCDHSHCLFPRWGKNSAVWGHPSLSRPLSELDFCLRPIPHLGACSQATLIQTPVYFPFIFSGDSSDVRSCPSRMPCFIGHCKLIDKWRALASIFLIAECFCGRCLDRGAAFSEDRL